MAFYSLLVIFVALSATNLEAKELNVLFIGNSYTYVNDVPKLIENLAQASGLTLKHEQHTEGGWTLEKHWNSQETQSKIHQGNWDVVVIQEYSTRTSEKPQDICRISFPYAKKLADEVHQYSPNAKIQWYLTWGRPFGDSDRCSEIPRVCTFEGMQDAITETYTTYGCMFKAGQVAPVGEGFREYKEMYGDNAYSHLYRTDDHHASLKGSYLSACVHFSTLFGVPCLGNTYGAGLDAGDVEELQIAADLAVEKADWTYPADSNCNLSMC